MDRGPESPEIGRDSAFRALQDQFRRGLRARWAQIESAPDTAGRIAALHRLAGAAGGYGLAELDTAARQALALVEAAAAPGRQHDALQCVRQAIDAASIDP